MGLLGKHPISYDGNLRRWCGNIRRMRVVSLGTEEQAQEREERDAKT